MSNIQAPEAKPRQRKPSASKTSASAQVTKSAAKASKTTVSATVASITSEERDQMIREAAYFRAERRGFVGGDPAQDWLDAEAEINTLLSK